MKKPLTAVIVDDELDSRQMMISLLQKSDREVEIVGNCKNAQQGFDIIMDKNPDFVLLDIQMPVKDGFWLADMIQNLRKRPYLVFVTAYNEYAMAAIKHSAFDFLLKPIVPDELEKTLDRVEDGLSDNNFDSNFARLNDFISRRRFRLNTNTGFVLITVDEIVYCEAKGNYTNVYLINGHVELVCMQLGELEAQLEGDFVRISRSITINLNMIEKVNRKTKCVFINDGLQKYELLASKSGIKKLYNVEF